MAHRSGDMAARKGRAVARPQKSLRCCNLLLAEKALQSSSFANEPVLPPALIFVDLLLLLG